MKEQEEQTALWKSKWDALAKLYTQLRDDHLDTLTTMKQLNAGAKPPVLSPEEERLAHS